MRGRGEKETLEAVRKEENSGDGEERRKLMRQIGERETLEAEMTKGNT